MTRMYHIILIVIGISTSLVAQEKFSLINHRKEKAAQQIFKLKESVLIVRLPSHHNKIEAFENLISETDISGKSRQSLIESLENTRSERDQFAQETMAAAQRYFSFTKVLFMYDSAQVGLTKGMKSGIFLNDQLKIDPSISLKVDTFFILRFGFPGHESTNHITSWIVSDRDLNDLQRPFPYYSRIYGLPKKLRYYTYDFDRDVWIRVKNADRSTKVVRKSDRVMAVLNSQFIKFYVAAKRYEKLKELN